MSSQEKAKFMHPQKFLQPTKTLFQVYKEHAASVVFSLNEPHFSSSSQNCLDKDNFSWATRI